MVDVVGRTDAAAFTGTSSLNFGSGNTNLRSYQATASATVNFLETRITGFSDNNNARVVVYEAADEAGPYSIVGTFTIPSSAGSPQQTPPDAPFSVTLGNWYNIGIWGDVNTVDVSFINSSSDGAATVSSGGGTGGLQGSFASPDPDRAPIEEPIDGEVFWYLDGTVTATLDLGLRDRLMVPGTNNPVADGVYQMRALDLAGDAIGPMQNINVANGDFEVTFPGLTAVDEVFALFIQSAAVTDITVSPRVIGVRAIDMNA